MDKKDIAHKAVSPRTLAAAIGVSESSVKRWIDAGRIQVSRTAGGHRRVPVHAAVRFIREQGMEVLQPDALGLPEHATDAAYSDPSLITADLLYDLLLSEHADQAAAHIVSAYVAGGSLAELFDGPVREALERLGALWHDDEYGIFSEHRATQLFIQALGQIRMLLPAPGIDAPRAVGGAPEHDPYFIPTAMSALICAASGLQDTNLGPHTPLSAFENAIAETKPSLTWLSLSSSIDDAAMKTVETLQAAYPDVQLVIGGRQAHELDGTIDDGRTLILSSMEEFQRTIEELVPESQAA